jgi:serine/threonine protein phosphatase PrpC
MAFTAALAATKGARSYQEDAAVLWPGGAAQADVPDMPPLDGMLVAVLADGMGGHAGGALASRTACESFLAAFASEHGQLRDRLRVGLNASNRAIRLEVEANRALRGMGTTLVGTVFGPDGLEWVSVGDSPLYLWRGGQIALVNEDHSLAPLLDELARAGRISTEQARTDSRRHMLRSAVTGEEIDLVDLAVKPLMLQAGDHVVLASDGIHTLDEGEIERIVAAYVDDGPRAIAAALVRSVEGLRDPHQDNFTVVVVRADADAPTQTLEAPPEAAGPE